MTHPSLPVTGGQSAGVPPQAGSGYSAEPEPSSTVSAVPVSIPNARAARWAAFDAEIQRRQHWEAAPYFVQGAEGALWTIQYLCRPELPHYGRLWRLLFNPPKLNSWEHEAYYNGWPGDQRGWMKFESKDAALDFFKLATRQIDIEEMAARSRARPCGPYESIGLDSDGDPVASAIEARRAATENTGAVHESAGPKDDAQPGDSQ